MAKRELPNLEGIIPEAHQTMGDVVDWLNDDVERGSTSYGHGIGLLGQSILNQETVPLNLQKEKLRESALLLIERYGDKIREFMRPELREALDLNEIRE